MRVRADDAPARRRQGRCMTMTIQADQALTPREREVATLLAYGHTNNEIAARLVISVRTAEMHRANVMRKLRFERRAELVRWALDHGLLH
jgi:DNA-binding CsgD family transcriptional regulator